MIQQQIEHIHRLFLETSGICTDTRKITPDCLFVALKGDNFDGNAFALQALKLGAKYSLADNPSLIHEPRCIVVENALKTLQDLAAFHRSQFFIPVLAITGTNGKTTTKELVARVLKTKYEIIHTEGNLNNHIGVPLTLLKINKNTRFAIIEMGANHVGEIRTLCQMAKPDHGIITNIGKAHLEGFGGYEGVIKAKSELYQYVKENGGFLFVNADQPLLVDLSSGAGRLLYGTTPGADVTGKVTEQNPYLSMKWNYLDKSGKIESKLYGAYNLSNILAAISVGLKFGVEEERIRDSILSYQPDNLRSQLKKTERNTLYIDAYNANPSSMAEAIKNFSLIQAKDKIVMLGDMLELGEETQSEHRVVISLLSQLNCNKIILVGKEFKSAALTTDYLLFDDVDQVIEWLKDKDIHGNSILIKGSRGIHLEKVIPYL